MLGLLKWNFFLKLIVLPNYLASNKVSFAKKKYRRYRKGKKDINLNVEQNMELLLTKENDKTIYL